MKQYSALSDVSDVAYLWQIIQKDFKVAKISWDALAAAFV